RGRSDRGHRSAPAADAGEGAEARRRDLVFPRRLYAHRGASAERPENTMPAFERALELGADALEMDVHLTRDGELVVAHDDAAATRARPGCRGPSSRLWSRCRRCCGGNSP